MKKIYLLLTSVVVGVAVALTYYIFEGVVHGAIDLVWDHLFDTNTYRWLVAPVCLVLSLLYFWMVHHIDPLSEHKEVDSGHVTLPPPTVMNILKILIIGFFSLVAGASLGPEAILVPSCMLIGAYISMKLFVNEPASAKLLSAAGFVALFAAFFNSFLVGVASILLVMKEAKVKASIPFILVTVIASAASTLTLAAIRGKGLIELSSLTWTVDIIDMLMLAIVFVLGFGATHLLGFVRDAVNKYAQPVIQGSWWVHGLVAAAGLIVIYLIGGPLVQFTGNQAIQPLAEQASTLGIIGILYIVLIKIIAIAWSRTIGYRGGMIFPSIFVLSGFVFIIGFFVPINYVYGLIVGFIGMAVANNKVNILF